MAFVIPPGRNPVIREAFALKAAAERRMKRIASMTKAKPEPTPEPKKNAKPPAKSAARKGKR